MMFIFKKIDTESTARKCIKVGLFTFVLLLVNRLFFLALALFEHFVSDEKLSLIYMAIEILVDGTIIICVIFLIYWVYKERFWAAISLFILTFSPLLSSFDIDFNSNHLWLTFLIIISVAVLSFQAVRGSYFLRQKQ